MWRAPKALMSTNPAIWRSQSQWSDGARADAMGAGMSAGKIILIVVLLLVAMHLLLFGYLKRQIAAAKRDKGL
jgi:hypothetical protein